MQTLKLFSFLRGKNKSKGARKSLINCRFKEAYTDWNTVTPTHVFVKNFWPMEFSYISIMVVGLRHFSPSVLLKRLLNFFESLKHVVLKSIQFILTSNFCKVKARLCLFDWYRNTFQQFQNASYMLYAIGTNWTYSGKMESQHTSKILVYTGVT